MKKIKHPIWRCLKTVRNPKIFFSISLTTFSFFLVPLFIVLIWKYISDILQCRVLYPDNETRRLREWNEEEGKAIPGFNCVINNYGMKALEVKLHQSSPRR
jgi:hypothetical protein